MSKNSARNAFIDFIIYIPFIKSFDNCYVFYEIGQTMGICTPAGFTTSFG